jgi:hypothetical protein
MGPAPASHRTAITTTALPHAKPGGTRPPVTGPALRCLLMTRDDARLWTDRSCLQDVQYRTDANLAARQSIYAYQHPRLDLADDHEIPYLRVRGDQVFPYLLDQRFP